MTHAYANAERKNPLVLVSSAKKISSGATLLFLAVKLIWKSEHVGRITRIMNPGSTIRDDTRDD